MPNYTLSVVVHDNGIPSGECVRRCKSTTALATVLINDVNEPPYFTTANFTPSASTRTKRSARLLAALGWDDPDRGQMHYFGDSVGGEQGQVLSSDADALQAFEFLDSLSETIVTKAVLNFEYKPAYDFKVSIRDEQGLTNTANVAVTVVDTNDPPTVIDPMTIRVPENYLGNIGRYAADDEDCCFSAVNPDWGLLSFALDDDTHVEIETLTMADATTSPNVSTIVAYDYEAAASHTIDVTVTDGGGLLTQGSLVIEVINVNDAPVFSGISCPFRPTCSTRPTRSRATSSRRSRRTTTTRSSTSRTTIPTRCGRI